MEETSSRTSKSGARAFMGPDAYRHCGAALLVTGLLFSLSPLASPATALALGIALALVFGGSPMPRLNSKFSGMLLRFGVVLLGFRMSFKEVLDTGVAGLLTASLTIIGTMGLGYVIGRHLGIGSRTSTLISAGTAVCGGSAIAAMAPVVGAAGGEIAVALGTVFVLNAVALYLFPLIGDWLAMAPDAFGLWSGIAIHDLSSVVGAASQHSPDALQIAVAVKLSRTLWIVPLALSVGLLLRQRVEGPRQAFKFPYFILFFLLASLSRDWVPGVDSVASFLGQVSKALLTAALFVIGTGISPRSLREVGWRPMTQGVILWVFISAAALLAALTL